MRTSGGEVFFIGCGDRGKVKREHFSIETETLTYE